MPAGESTRFRGDERRTRRANQGLKTFQPRPPTAGRPARSGVWIPEVDVDGATLFAVVELHAADHAAGGPRGGRPGLHALGVHRGLEDVAERVPARRPPAAPRKSESLFAVVEVPAADHAAGGREVGGRACMRLACTEDSKT